MFKYFDNTLLDEVIIPKETCHKCGKHKWSLDDEYTWVCQNCGNLIMLNYGVLFQQIDVVMQANDRKSEFVKSIDGKTIKPKKNEELKNIKFNQAIKASSETE